MLDFYVEFFGDRFSATFSILTAEKHAWKIAENFGEKIVFRVFFSLCFRFSLATPYFEQLFTFKPKNFAQNPLCEKFPLRKGGPKHREFTGQGSLRGGGSRRGFSGDILYAYAFFGPDLRHNSLQPEFWCKFPQIFSGSCLLLNYPEC